MVVSPVSNVECIVRIQISLKFAGQPHSPQAGSFLVLKRLRFKRSLLTASVQADERLLLEGQYERARQQLEAARPRPACEEDDDDVTEYIRTDAEVKGSGVEFTRR